LLAAESREVDVEQETRIVVDLPPADRLLGRPDRARIRPEEGLQPREDVAPSAQTPARTFEKLASAATPAKLASVTAGTPMP
jgi:hypothetical protein